MSKLIARLILAMLTLPLAGTVFLITLVPLAVTTTTGGPDALVAFYTWLATYTFVVIYWYFIWRDGIAWTRQRRDGTIIAAATGAGASVAAFTAIRAGLPGVDPIGAVFFSGGLAPIVFVTTTVILWRETSEERAARLAARGVEVISCLACGYNLTGLKAAQCPECGAEFTLDVLLAGQRRETEV